MNKNKKFSLLKKKATPYFYLSPTIISIVVLMLVPIVMVASYSFFDNVIMTPESNFVGVANYITVLTDPVFWEAGLNTLIFTASSVFFHMLIGLSFALMLNSNLLSRFTKSFFRVIYILPWVFTAAIIAILWKLMLNPNGIINYFLETLGIISTKIEWLGARRTALFAVTLINIWSGYPFYMVSLLAGLQGISGDIYEAAKVDGATGIQKLLYITLPQLKPIIVSMAMLDVIWTLQQFSLIWMTTGGGPIHTTEMLSTYTYKFAFSTYEFSMASTSAVIILIVSICLAVFYVKAQKARD